MALSNRDQANFKAARDQMEQWVASVRTLLRPNTSGNVNPSPHLMQQLITNSGNSNNWSRSLFAHIREVWLDLSNVEKEVMFRVVRTMELLISLRLKFKLS